MKTIITLILLITCTNVIKSQSPIDDLANRVTENTVNGRIIFKLSETDNKDYFEIDKSGEKVIIQGNSYISLATGFNWYLKYIANIHISWNNLSEQLPKVLPLPSCKIKRTTNMKNRYYLNYCTFSYSMAFWDWKRWEKEIDWMALHGINMPLSITGIEVVWYNLLKRIGYSINEINNFISGPAYMPWWQMGNLEGWGGPNPESWYIQQEKLQKKIISRYKELGIEAVYPGFSGMVPHNINKKLGYNIKDQGKWLEFTRPGFLSPEDPNFERFAKLYYEELEKLYGKSKYYSMDPFHEGGNIDNINLDKAGKAIMKAMKKNNPSSIWVIQSWQRNPREDLIKNLNHGDIIILDLYSDKYPQWGDPNSIWYREKGFGKHNWIYCMLLNFGGNVGINGRIDQLVEGYFKACNHPNGKKLSGVGSTPEGIENNPIMFELLYELPWYPERFSTDEWLTNYLKSRYGSIKNTNIIKAWNILKKTVYNAPNNYGGDGTSVQSVFCARPSLNIDKVSTWGCSKLFYNADSTALAAKLFVSAADEYKGNNNYEYDMIDIVRQSIADKGNVMLKKISKYYNEKDVEKFQECSNNFLSLILLQNKLLSSREEFHLYKWINEARSKGEVLEEKKLYERNASTLITVWGDSIAANVGGLHEYSHREWAGILKDLYYVRWKKFFNNKLEEIKNKKEYTEINFYNMEKKWIDNNYNKYLEFTKENPIEIAQIATLILNNDI